MPLADLITRKLTEAFAPQSVRVVDESPLNDWTAVRFWNAKAGAFGRVYPAYGFVYRQGTA